MGSPDSQPFASLVVPRLQLPELEIQINLSGHLPLFGGG
jgi:hypothetical protein